MAKGIEVLAKPPSSAKEILSAEALAFVEKLYRQFQPTRQSLLKHRAERQAEFDAGALPKFLPETESVRTGAWKPRARTSSAWSEKRIRGIPDLSGLPHF